MTDRNAAKEVLFRLRLMHPEIPIVWADSAYAGQLVAWARTYLDLTIKTVSRPKNVPGFVVLPRRWVVERSHAWIMHARRHARDYERLIQHSESLITWAAITLMTRRITRRSSRRTGQPDSREAQRDRSKRRWRSPPPPRSRPVPRTQAESSHRRQKTVSGTADVEIAATRAASVRILSWANAPLRRRRKLPAGGVRAGDSVSRRSLGRATPSRCGRGGPPPRRRGTARPPWRASPERPRGSPPGGRRG